MRIPIILAAVLLAAATAHAAVPPFTADCAPGLQVRADAQGTVRINGRVARLIPRPDGQTTALAGGIYIDITPRGSAPPYVSYTARDKSIGRCEIVAFGGTAVAAAPPRALAGTRWRLVEFQSMDDHQGTKRPHDPSLYTMQLGSDGRVQMRLNCNRAQGDWSAEPAADRLSGRFQFGPLAATRALCPPPSMDETVVTQAPYVRGYLLQDGRLHLSLMADGGIFVWEPDPAAAPAAKGPAGGGGHYEALRDTVPGR
jgi:heat shock protein HslJ